MTTEDVQLLQKRQSESSEFYEALLQALVDAYGVLHWRVFCAKALGLLVGQPHFRFTLLRSVFQYPEPASVDDCPVRSGCRLHFRTSARALETLLAEI